MCTGEMTSILDLPENVLEFICRLLANSPEIQDIFPYYLYDLLAFRSCCVYFNNVVKNLILLLNCQIIFEWFVAPQNESLLKLLDFVKNDTNWCIKYLRIESQSILADYDVLSFLQQNEDLLHKNVEKLLLAIPEYNQTSVDKCLKVFDWLERFALTTTSSVSLIVSKSSIVSCVNPQLVSEIFFMNVAIII